MDCTTEIGVVLQISPTNKLLLQNDLVRLVEQVFILRTRYPEFQITNRQDKEWVYRMV